MIRRIDLMNNESKRGVNLLTVSWRAAIIIALITGAVVCALLVPGAAGIVLAALLGASAIPFTVQLIIWASKWIKQECVSELGLQIVRFSVIITAAVMTIFIMLSIDYTRQHSESATADLMQTTLAGRIYMQSAITDQELTTNNVPIDNNQNINQNTMMQEVPSGSEIPSAAEIGPLNNPVYSSIQYAVDNLLLRANQENNKMERRVACFYFLDENETLTTFKSDPAFSPGVNDSSDYQLIYQHARRDSLDLKHKTLGGLKYNVSSCPVYSESGRLCGLLEIYEQKGAAISIFRFAGGELWLSVAGLIALFSFGFYGIMQLADILLRPRQFDPTKILPFGRESVRPVLFFAALAITTPLYHILYDDGAHLSELLDSKVSGFLSLSLFLIGVIAGLALARLPKNRLLAFPAYAGAFAGLAAFSAAEIIGNPYASIITLPAAGLGLGVNYRTAARYQVHSDAVYGRDDYSYLSPALGTISGILLGGFSAGKISGYGAIVLSCALMAASGIVSIIMLRGIKFTDKYGMNGKEKLVSLKGPLVILSAVGLSVIYSVIYLPSIVVSWKMPGVPAAFCAILPMTAFCTGNRLRLHTRAGQRLALFVSGIFSAVSFLPVIIWTSIYTLVFSILLSSCAVLFLSAVMYSVLQPAEMRRLLRIACPLSFVGLVIFAGIFTLDISNVLLLVPAGITAALTTIFISVSRFPLRRPSDGNFAAITGEVQKDAFLFSNLIKSNLLKKDKKNPPNQKETPPKPEPEIKSGFHLEPEFEINPEPEIDLDIEINIEPPPKPKPQDEAKTAPEIIPEIQPEQETGPPPEIEMNIQPLSETKSDFSGGNEPVAPSPPAKPRDFYGNYDSERD